jgi:acetyltransferase-like isoleucine patch superfamily enzyme
MTSLPNFAYVGEGAHIYDPHLSIFLRPEMIYIHGGARLDGLIKVEGGLGVTIHPGVHISSFAHLNVGGGKLVIGPNVAITSGAAILSGTNTMAGRAMSSAASAEMQVVERKTTIIGECAFIGSRAIVYPGVTVGRFAVVKAGSVVTKDVPDYVIVAGTPAVVVGTRKLQADGTMTVRYLPKLRDLAVTRDIERVREHYNLPEGLAVELVDMVDAMTQELVD